MMAGPTDLLNEDVKELKGELRDARRIDVSPAELRSDARSAIGFGKWAGTALVTVLLTGGVTAIIWGARLDAKVAAMESWTSEKFQEAGARIDKLESKMDARFDKLETAIGRLAEQIRAATPAAAK